MVRYQDSEVYEFHVGWYRFMGVLLGDPGTTPLVAMNSVLEAIIVVYGRPAGMDVLYPHLPPARVLQAELQSQSVDLGPMGRHDFISCGPCCQLC